MVNSRINTIQGKMVFMSLNQSFIRSRFPYSSTKNIKHKTYSLKYPDAVLSADAHHAGKPLYDTGGL
jgi:hypothetical protein